jgi:hypothetical protein
LPWKNLIIALEKLALKRMSHSPIAIGKVFPKKFCPINNGVAVNKQPEIMANKTTSGDPSFILPASPVE